MNHADVKRVEEVRTSYEANRFLELGWVLLQVFPATGYQDRWPYYIMGWTTNENNPEYPAN
mgnify:CR=1 FL=1